MPSKATKVSSMVLATTKCTLEGTDLIADDCEKIILGPRHPGWDQHPYQPIQFRA